MTHPYRLHAVAALHSLHRATGYLADTRDAVVIARPQLGPAATRPRSLAALRAHDELLRAERADRITTFREGITPIGGSPAPIGPGLLDIERDLATGLREVTQRVTSALRRHPGLGYHAARHDTWAYLARALPVAPPHLAREVHTDLARLDGRLRALVGLDPDWWPLPGGPPCPACGRRTLAAQTSATDSGQWSVVCTSGSCACQGRRCACTMSSRPAGIRHIWPAPALPAVQQLLADWAAPVDLPA